MASAIELAAMRQAIMLSAQGLGTTSPNPPVGCVILDSQNRVAGTGFHRRKGEPHAEVHALQAAGEAARGGTAVVTLEPCNHVGVTPACRQTLFDAGIIRVVIGLIDPTSRGDGGAAVLAKAGVDVEVGVLAEEVLTVLRPWLTATVRSRPYISWAYTIGDDSAGQPEHAILRSLRTTVDVTVLGDSIEEGTPGGHSVQHLRLADLRPYQGDTGAWMAAMHQAGVRSMLLVGTSNAATALCAVDAIDEFVVIKPRKLDSPLPELTQHHLNGFEIMQVGGADGSLIVHVRRLHAPDPDSK